MSDWQAIVAQFQRDAQQIAEGGERIIQDINKNFDLAKEEQPMPAVKLIAYTKPMYGNMAISEFIAYCARVSNPANQSNTLTAPKLLKYLATHRHWSPFEMANLVIEIETTRDIARQILRHRSFSFQEFSQRYAEVESAPVFREARLQDKANRQSSIETDDEKLQSEWDLYQWRAWHAAESAYKWALDKGIAKEVARAVLPEGLTTSRMYVNGTIRSWIHYCSVRMDASTQKEHREIAQACWAIVVDAVPALGEIEL
jgi:thymidylate synthase (FAD)